MGMKKQVQLYNRHMESVMSIHRNRNTYILKIDGIELSRGSSEDILKRIKVINREHGLTHLED